MRTRGRRSAADEAVIITGSFGQRPEPPTDLTEREVEIWREIVASEDPNTFRTAATRGLLSMYCQRRAASEKISGVINKFQDEWLTKSSGIAHYRSLLSARDLEARAAISLATKLRITNQSRYSKDAAAVAARRQVGAGLKPWEEE